MIAKENSHRDLRGVLILVIMLIFSAIYSYNSTTPAFTTSDETINYVFSRLYAETGRLYYMEELNLIADGIIRPRGVLIIGEKMVSRKFLGLPLYFGSFTVITGETFLFYFTSLISCMGALFSYLFGKELFGRQNGILSSILSLILPPYWYWNSFPLFENTFASVIFLLGLVWIFRGLNKNRPFRHFLLAAIFLGTSWNIRPDTTLYLVPVMLIIALNMRRLNLRSLIVPLSVFILMVSPTLVTNKELYGSYLAFPYTGGLDSMPPPGLSWQKDWFPVMLVNLKNLSEAFPLSPLLVVSLVLAWKSDNRRASLCRFYALFLLSSLLVFSLYYLSGSPPKRGGGLHESYTRYFLPIYLASMPLLSSLVQYAGRSYETRRISRIVVILLILTFVVDSVAYTVSSLGQVWLARERYAQIREFIIDNTEPSSIVFVWGLDKIVYPERTVATINLLSDGKLEEQVCEVALSIPSEYELYVYEYGPFDLDLIVRELDKCGYRLERIDGGSLYRILRDE